MKTMLRRWKRICNINTNTNTHSQQQQLEGQQQQAQNMSHNEIEQDTATNQRYWQINIQDYCHMECDAKVATFQRNLLSRSFLFRPNNVGGRSLQTVCTFLPDYTISHPRQFRETSSLTLISTVLLI
jgi:hypothetical protein